MRRAAAAIRSFAAETCQSVFQATGGVPRLINQVCDHALVLAYVAGHRRIEPSNIEEAWGDLQQLPAPGGGESKDDQAGGVIEFGSLDDQADSTPGTTAPSAAPAPALWIASAEEDREGDQSEPVQQIHRIERLLAAADDDFQPAGSIGPEVELCFDNAAHPFQEQFAEEEVVADRYAAVAVAAPLPEKAAAGSEPVRANPEKSASDAAPVAAALPAEPEWELIGASAPTGDHAQPATAAGARAASDLTSAAGDRLRRRGGASIDNCSRDSAEGNAMGLMGDALRQIDDKTLPAPVILPLARAQHSSVTPRPAPLAAAEAVRLSRIARAARTVAGRAIAAGGLARKP